MSFSDEGNALIKNLHQYKEYGSQRLMMEFVEIKWNKRALNSLPRKQYTGITGREFDSRSVHCQVA